MKIELINKSFTNLKTAVLYKFSKYIPDSIEGFDIEELKRNHTATEIRYLGNTEILDENDNLEYGFSFLIDKDKFNDNRVTQFLDNHTKDLIGKEVTDIMLAEKTIIPTISEVTEEVSSYNYFGTAIYNKVKFMSLRLGEDFYKVELYDGIVENTESFIEYDLLRKIDPECIAPNIVITLGPNKDVSTNPNNWYYELEFDSVSRGTVEPRYSRLVEEIKAEKFLCISFPEKGNEDLKVNLVYESWLKDKENPLRNLHKYLLRNDDFYGLKTFINPVEALEKSNILVDKNTGTILGNNEIIPLDNCLILSRKKQNVNKINNWNKSIRYNTGDKVIYFDTTWESLDDNNLGNVPPLSSSWEEIDNFTNYYTSRLQIFQDKRGEINPSGLITISDDTSYLEITIKDKPGYELDYSKIKVYPDYNGAGEIQNANSKFFEHYKSQDWGHIILFSSEEGLDILNNISNLYFDFNKLIFNLGFNITLQQPDSIDYLNWETWYNDNKEDLLVSINNSLVSKLPVEVLTEDKVSISMGGTKYKLLSITDNQGVDILPLSENINTQITPTREDEISGGITYTLHLKINTLKAFYSLFEGFIVSNSQPQLIGYDNPYTIGFYIEDEDLYKFSQAEIITSTGEVISFSENDFIESNKSRDSMSFICSKENGIYYIKIPKLKSDIEIKLYKISK